MNNKITISIKGKDAFDVIKTLVRFNIYYRDLICEKDEVILNIYEESFEKICVLFNDVDVINYHGIKRAKYFFNKHKVVLLSFLLSYIFIILLSNIIFSVDIITNNNNIREILLEELNKEDIKKYKFIKSYKEIEGIKKKILENNKDNIEWLEIERIGTRYIINVTERIIAKKGKDERYTDIVASKDGMIKYIVSTSGVKVKEVNDVVKKGEVLITGKIINNEEVKSMVNSSGRVYAEVWYTVNTSVPYKHIKYEKTGEIINHIYLDVFGKKFTLIGKYETDKSMNETETLVEKPFLFFKVMNESKELYNYKEVNLSVEEAYEEAIKRSDKAIVDKLNVDEYIIDKKVLKKEEYSSKINIEVFYRVYENIALEVEMPIEKLIEGE